MSLLCRKHYSCNVSPKVGTHGVWMHEDIKLQYSIFKSRILYNNMSVTDFYVQHAQGSWMEDSHNHYVENINFAGGLSWCGGILKTLGTRDFNTWNIKYTTKHYGLSTLFLTLITHHKTPHVNRTVVTLGPASHTSNGRCQAPGPDARRQMPGPGPDVCNKTP